jgi:hypothetical protein
MWTRSYFCSTAGNVSSSTIERYIANQKSRWRRLKAPVSHFIPRLKPVGFHAPVLSCNQIPCKPACWAAW